MRHHDLIPYDQALEEGLGIELGMKLASVSSEQTNMLPCLGGGADRVIRTLWVLCNDHVAHNFTPTTAAKTSSTVKL